MLRFLIGFSFVAVASVAMAQTIVTTPATPVTTVTTPATTTTTTTTPTGTVVERTIVTPTPAAKEVIATPSGFVNCFTVAAAWVKNVWVPAHQVCQYENTTQGVVWVEGYWKCTAYKTDVGECTSWDWQPGRWEKSFTVY